MEKTCENCAHWGTRHSIDNGDWVIGQCLRLPPQVVVYEEPHEALLDSYEQIWRCSKFPVTSSCDVCGEHRC